MEIAISKVGDDIGGRTNPQREANVVTETRTDRCRVDDDDDDDGPFSVTAATRPRVARD